jgi:hypothetical protein
MGISKRRQMVCGRSPPVLRLGVFPCQLPAAVRTLRRRGNCDHFIDLFGNVLAAMRAVGLAGLSAGPLRFRVALAAGERRGLTLVGTQRLI